MKSFRVIVMLTAALVMAGCSSINEARRVQFAQVDKSRVDYVPAAAKLDLRGYTLERLIGFAMTNRPSVVTKTLAVKDARLALKELNADAPLVSDTPWTAPHFALSGTYSEKSAGTSLDKAKFNTIRSNPTATLSLDLPIWDFGRHHAKARSQAEAILAAEIELVNHGYEVFYEVANAYFTLLEKGALMEVAYTNEYQYAQHLDRAKRMYETGEVKELDLLKAELDLSKAREKTANSIKDVQVAGVGLMKALGVEADRGTREEVMDFSENALSFVLKGFPETSYTIGEAYELARTNSPSMQLAKAKLRGASADVDYAVADLYPELQVNSTLTWTDPLWYFGWGVSTAETLFQGFRKTTALERATVALEKASANVDVAEQDLSLSLEEAIVKRDNAKIARATASESLQHALDNLNLINRQYEVGDVSRVDFTDAVADYVTAMGSRISAFYSWQRSEAAIFSLIGTYPVYEEKKITEEMK